MENLVETPQIDFLILADRVEAVNGKLYLMGGAWDRLNVVNFDQPVAFGLVASVLVPWNSANEQHPLLISIEHEDGQKVVPDIQFTLSAGRPPDAIKGQSFRAMVAVNGIWKLQRPGTYRVGATLADKQEKRVVFHVIQAVPR